ncbi:MAG: hypothetical protein R3325_00270 [Thermoanaerobaculia bacterium]|nr:hypothetical protein [Thermoanaerobaculia bacterium]
MSHAFPLSTLRRLPAAAAVALLLFPGCSGGESSDGETAEVTAAEVKTQVKEAARAVKSYTFNQKEEFEAWGRKRLAKLDLRLEKLREEAAQATGDARKELSQSLAALESQRKELDAKLEAALASSSDAWDDLRSGFSQAQKELGKAIRSASGEPEGEDESADE